MATPTATIRTKKNRIRPNDLRRLRLISLANVVRSAGATGSDTVMGRVGGSWA